MECEATSRKAKLCKVLACGCRRVCSCKNKSTENHDKGTKHYPPGADYWSPNPCRPWITSWFDGKEEGYSNTYQSEMESSQTAKLDYKRDLYQGGRHVFPTQSRRGHGDTETMPIPPILPPGHSIIGHPSLKIYKFRLPNHLLSLLDQIVDSCAHHASNLPTGWT